MSRKILPVLFLLTFILCRGNAPIDVIQDEKPTVVDNTAFENSIKRQERIIHNPDSKPYAICRAYYEKYLIYKDLFNYDQAIENLDLALEAGLKTDRKEEIVAQYKLEKLLVYFDLLEYEKVSELISQISDDDVKYFRPRSLSFYWLVLARMEIRKGNTNEADVYLNEALATLIENEPHQVPLVYRKKIELYKSLGQNDKVIESFETGLAYAKKHQISAYELGLYDDMINYYSEMGDYKNPKYIEAVQQVKKLATAHDGTNRSSKLLRVEKELLQKRKQLEVEKEKRNRNLLIALIVALSIVLLLLCYFYKCAKDKRILAELETNNMRDELERVTKELNESGQTKLDLNDYNLTERQLQIIDLVKQGKSNKEIGEDLFISVNTVKYHLKIIYEVLNISNRSEL